MKKNILTLFKLQNIYTLIGIFMLFIAVGYNLWLYKLEPTAKIDPNDNPFQFALVYRTNEIWDFAVKSCPKNIQFPLCLTGYLVDHTVPNWAQGYSLPFYYSHIPQIAIVGTYRLFNNFGLINLLTNTFNYINISDTAYQTKLFVYYHIVIYLLLCLFPVSVFISLKILKTPWVIAGFGALIASHISTDGLYGLDPSSFLWRGYGLSSQLFAMIWMPLALAYAWRFIHHDIGFHFYNLTFEKKSLTEIFKLRNHLRILFPAVFFLMFSIMGHLGLGLITVLSIGILALSPSLILFLNKAHRQEIFQISIDNITKLILIISISMFFVAYWVIPVLLYDQYHNISFWDPVWKFDSYGWREVITQFLNGDLFDFGRIPAITVLILIGGFATFILRKSKKSEQPSKITTTKEQIQDLYPFTFLFFFWLLMYFGRTTWGNLIDIIPGMKEFHQSRFIVGVHLSGFFLVSIGFWWFTDFAFTLCSRVLSLVKKQLNVFSENELTFTPNKFSENLYNIFFVIVAFLLIFIIYPQTYRYSNFNDVLIKRGNENFIKQNEQVEKLIPLLKNNEKGRSYLGRGAGWGKDLYIAETTYLLHLSTYGIPIILWLPETWSPNSDIEQFFIDDWIEHYDLLNIRYVVTPKDIEPKPFWKKIQEHSNWILYSVPTSGYFTTGSQAAVVYSDKRNFVNVVRLWLQSDYVKQGIFPQLTFNKKESINNTLPNFQMIDEASYTIRDEKEYSIFGDQPRYEAPKSAVTISGPEKITNDMIFETNITVGENCSQCLVILKYTSHPNWKAYLNGKQVPTITVFPFYIGIPVQNAGNYSLVVKYEPMQLKMILLVLGTIAVVVFVIITYIIPLFYKKTKKSS